ncbi:hypothetical protein ACFLZP_03955 [Patescibacteria group bacterium]
MAGSLLLAWGAKSRSQEKDQRTEGPKEPPLKNEDGGRNRQKGLFKEPKGTRGQGIDL